MSPGIIGQTIEIINTVILQYLTKHKKIKLCLIPITTKANGFFELNSAATNHPNFDPVRPLNSILMNYPKED